MGGRELSLIDRKIASLHEVPLSPTVTSLTLHCNHIPRIEGLSSAWHLLHLDLSSNCISKIEGLSSLTSLRTLNLSCNLITKVEGLNGLVNITRLNLSHNQINSLAGLLYLHGPECKLKHLSLHGNCLDNVNHLLQCLLGLQGLKEITLTKDDINNPICASPGYREIVLQSLLQISVLDGLDRLGNPSPPGGYNPLDIPGLEDFVDFLGSSDTSTNEAARGGAPHIATPRIDGVLTQFHQRIATAEHTDPITSPDPPPVEAGVAEPADPVNDQRIRKLEHQISELLQKRQAPVGNNSSSCTHAVVTVRKAKRDTDRTSESECESGKDKERRSRIPKRRYSTAGKTSVKGGRSDSDWEKPKSKSPRRKCGDAGGPHTAGPAGRGPLKATWTSKPSTRPIVEQEETYRAIVEERDQERERRWKAEQAVTKMTEKLKSLHQQVSEEKDLQSMALHTTDRLKDMLLKERSGRSGLQSRVQELEGKCQALTRQLEQSHSSEDQHKTALCSLEDSLSRAETLRAGEMKRYQELEKRAATLKKELDFQRATGRQHKDKLHQLHELLASREQEHRKELGLRLLPGGSDFSEAVSKEIASVEQKHSHRHAELEEKLAEGRKQYAALENEFRMALIIEATRFSEVKDAYDQVNAEMLELKKVLAQSQEAEKKSGSLLQELTTMVKEQKNSISQLIKAKGDAVKDLKGRLHSLEAQVGKERQLNLQLELFKKDKARLLSQLTAQESVIDGLRAERKIWGQELAQQGASLAQDRGRLEARIEVLSLELDTQKKQNEGDTDALKIKAKIISDQTDTIRKLKEAVQEREEQIHRLHEEAVQAKKRFQQQLDEETSPLAELKERLDQLILRKQELKELLEDKEVKLEEAKRLNSAYSKRWQEQEELLTKLESQVKSKKENFDSKERLLMEERDKATESHKAAVEKLHCVDDAFRRQLESIQAAHQAEMLRLANVKQKQIEETNQKVFEVEEEMRQLLVETETSKRLMEEKMKRLTSVLKDF
ncbi:leucine-rich repeat and coiled-coil domain-containing protein 1 [Genypterus blacodes]|uniref:leucine-rich repeat and coiled-coil domain-containing protein 1 n=1 Tax=Genypterus blacodes TaxID=154954 RepID=UPI003F76DEE2